MPHKRSKQKRLEREAKHQAALNLHRTRKAAFVHLKANTIYLREDKEFIANIEAQRLAGAMDLETVDPRVIPRVERGEVLSDPLGRGTLDREVY